MVADEFRIELAETVRPTRATSQTVKADARIRTADTFITSDGGGHKEFLQIVPSRVRRTAVNPP
jgi:hypothetical protein